MILNKWLSLGLPFLVLLLLGSLSPYACAEIIDDISVHTDANGDVDAVIKFTVPIQYLRSFPQGKSPFFLLTFNILNSVPADQWQDYESHRTPPSDLIQDITVSTRDRGTGPKVQLKFNRFVEISVIVGRNSQSLSIHIKPEKPQPKRDGKPATGLTAGATALLATAPIAAVPALATPGLAVPKISLPSGGAPAISKSGVATQPATTPAAIPAQPAVTAQAAVSTKPVTPTATQPAAKFLQPPPQFSEVTKPEVVLPPTTGKLVYIPLGGKEGLPAFPEIRLPVQPENIPPSQNPTLAEQIARANNQAAMLMVKGGSALLAGKNSEAMDAFNNVLKLAPNGYSQDAQIWIGITKEKSGMTSKALLEYQTYLKLYPNGNSAKWVKDRLDKMKSNQPALFYAAKPISAPVRVQNTEFQVTEFGSLSMYYYQGASQTNTTATVGAVQSPISLSVTDQKSLISNVSMTARSYNNEYDNRLVFQDFYAANLLPGQKSSNRLSAAYFETKNRIVNYSLKVGRQSALGGGVMGRFDGVTAGYGFSPDWRVNAVAGQLSDLTLGDKPKFVGTNLDFGIKNPFGGSVYFINQSVSGITDRRAVGGNLRYFDQDKTVIAMWDFDVQFKALNMITVQGTINGGGNGTDYNFLLDRRRAPILDIRNAVSGTTVPLATLIQNGFSTSDLVLLGNQRTAVSNTAQVGMTNHINEKWNAGTDVSVSATSGLQDSGNCVSDPVTGMLVGTAGCVAATPSSGSTWTVTERLTGHGVIQSQDVTNFSLTYNKSQFIKGESFQFTNHADIHELWSLDTMARLYLQNDSTGGKQTVISPSIRVGYKVKNNLNVEAQAGIDRTNASSSSTLQSSSTTTREFVSFGFQLNF